MGISVDPEAIEEAPVSSGDEKRKRERKTSTSSTSSRSSWTHNDDVGSKRNSTSYKNGVLVAEANPGDSFEELLQFVGTNDRWNYFLFLICSMGAFISPLQNLSYQFLGATPDHWCRIEQLIKANWTQEQIINFAIPRTSENGMLESCLQKDYDYDAVAEMGYEDAMASLGVLPDIGHETVSCSKRVYNLTQFSSTVVTQWDLVCDRRALYSTTQSAAQAGKLVGSIVFGYLTDMFGRRRVTLVSVCLFVLFSFLAASAPTINLYITLRALISFFDTGFYMACFILAMENCSPSRRSFVGSLYAVPWALGYMALPGIAYVVRDWQWLQVVLSLPSLLLFLYFGLLPESMRWLVMQGRLTEAMVVLEKAANFNKKALPRKEKLMDAMQRIYNKEKKERQRVNADCGGFCMLLGLVCLRVQRLCSTTRLLIQTTIIYFSWFSASLVYYGIALNATNLSANEYLYMFLGGALEIPSYLLLWPASALLGRKKSFIALFALCAVSIFTSFAVNQEDVATNMSLFLLGKVAITSAFQLVYLFTVELYPTRTRTLALGGANVCARIGSILSPYINDLVGETSHQAPAQLFGALSCITAFLALFLHETNHLNLTEESTDGGSLRTSREPPQVILHEAASQESSVQNVPTIEVESESGYSKDDTLGSVSSNETNCHELDARCGQDDEAGDNDDVPNVEYIKHSEVESDRENNAINGVENCEKHDAREKMTRNVRGREEDDEKPESNGYQNFSTSTQL
ncbi:organic cation transporter protein-like [Oratosquilla oratoria]|uniref:organic cation transporter protein-like n=1 Tax=Oratosquilla oratoria TaxID=337810 RepID=UPI003F76E5C7